jgi:hypothetical protein
MVKPLKIEDATWEELEELSSQFLEFKTDS